MSALDLFASALGAFILMAVVLMPFFLRVDPDEVQRLLAAAEAKQRETERQLAQARAENERQLDQARAENDRLKKQVQELLDAPKMTFPHLDVVIALDTSGSMGAAVDGLRQDIDEFAQLMFELAPSLGIGIIDFEDRCDMTTAVREFPLRLMNSSGFSSLVSFTGSLSAGSPSCNSDAEEALAMALDAGIASNWRRESEARIIVIITDNPAYPDKQASALAAARAFAGRGPAHRVSTVMTVTGGSAPGTEEYLRSLADAGNGNFTQGGRSFVVTMLFALAGL